MQILSKHFHYINENREKILAGDNVTMDSRYKKIYCKKDKSAPRERFEVALKEELAKLEHQMRVGYSTLRRLAEKIKLQRKVFEQKN